jgi:hypothetical protein
LWATDRYFKGIPKASRAAKPNGFLKEEQVTAAVRAKVLRLNEIAGASCSHCLHGVILLPVPNSGFRSRR